MWSIAKKVTQTIISIASNHNVHLTVQTDYHTLLPNPSVASARFGQLICPLEWIAGGLNGLNAS